jgi:hypothetical protein
MNLKFKSFFYKLFIALFKTMYGASNKQISLTNSHLIYVKNKGYIKVSDVNLGDFLRVYSNEKNYFDNFLVSRIDYELKTGFIAPLTQQGTLLVNQIDTSCYAEVNDHSVADLFMIPVKFWYKINKYLDIKTIKSASSNVDLDFYSKVLYQFGSKYFPSYLY